METIALYMRISSEDTNVGESNSIHNQRELLYEYIRNHQELRDIPILEFCDDGYSGMNFQRPGVQQLLSLAGSKVTCIIVKDFSRFGRNLIEVGDYLDQVFPFLGVRFIAVNEAYDSRQSRGSSIGLEVSIRAMIAEFYSRDISEKIRCVQQIKMRKGEYLCGIAFYGYQRSQVKKNQLVIDKAAAEVVQRIFTLASKGVSSSEIAIELNREGIPSPLMYRREQHTDQARGWNTAKDRVYWTQNSIRHILSDRRYTGCLISRKRTKEDLVRKQTHTLPKSEWIVAENTQEAIISEELFMQVQKRIKQKDCTKRNIAEKRQKKCLYCVFCGRKLQVSKGKKAYYFCPTGKITESLPCKRISLFKTEIEQIILGLMQMFFFLYQIDSVKEKWIEEEQSSRSKTFQRTIKRCKTVQRNIFENFAEGRIGEQKFLSCKREMIRQQEEAMLQYKESTERIEQIRQILDRENGIEWVNELGFQEEWIQTIQVHEEGRVEIIWNFQDIFM